MKVLVTGRRGFLGRALVRHLQGRGDLEILPDDPDVCAPIPSVATGAVVHLAARGSAREFAGDPREAYRTNVWGTIEVLEHCRRAGSRLVFPSTSGVYLPSPEPLSEDSPLRPPNAYAATKEVGEILCRRYAEDHGLTVHVLRLFNTYGPGQRSDFLVPYLFARAAAGEPVRLKTPDSVRDFVHAGDVALAIAASLDDPRPGFHLYNVGTGSGTRIRDLAARMFHVLGKPPRIEVEPDAPPDPLAHVVADPTRIRDDLGWRPRIPLSEGLATLRS